MNKQPKYRLVKYKGSGIRAVVIVSTVEIVKESEEPERYKELRKKAIDNVIARQKNEVLRDFCGTSARQARLDMGL